MITTIRVVVFNYCEKFAENNSNNNVEDEIQSGRNDDEFNMNNIPQTAYLDVDDYYQNLGIQCAQFALSIEVFGLVDEKEEENTSTYFGFPYLRLLSDRSGGNGPIILSLSHDEHDEKSNSRKHEPENKDIFLKEVLSRSTLTR